MQTPHGWPSLILTETLKLYSTPKLTFKVSQFLVPLFQNESMQNLSDENKLDLLENEPIGRIHFHRLVLTQAKGYSEMVYCHI